MKNVIKFALIVFSTPVLLLSVFAYGYWAGMTNSMGRLNVEGLIIVSILALIALVVGLAIKTD